MKQLRTESIDLLGDASGHSFIAVETVLVPAGQAFADVTPQDLENEERLARLPEAEASLTVKEVPAVYLFKTRDGHRGVLEVTSFGPRDASMDIRYKVLPSRWRYSRSMVILSPTHVRKFWSLRDAKSHAVMPKDDPVAYLLKNADGSLVLKVENAHNYPTADHQGQRLWETMSAEDISRPAGLAGLPFERNGTYELPGAGMPRVVLIPEYGLLQINGVDDRTEQVVIEYKRATTEPPAPVKGSNKQRRRSNRLL